MKILTKAEPIERFKSYWPYFVMGMLLFLIGLRLFIFVFFNSTLYNWIPASLSLAPGLIILARWRYAKNLPSQKWKMALQSILSSIGLLLLFGFLAVQIFTMMMFFVRLKNPFFYWDVIRFQDQSPVISHFPEKIPPTSDNVEFFFVPAFLQGGTFFHLQYKTTPEEIDELEKKFRPQAEYIFFTDKERDMSPGDNEELDIRYASYLFNDEYGWFPETFEIFVFESTPYGKDNFPWNHATTRGVAIDKTNSLIFYWLEEW